MKKLACFSLTIMTISMLFICPGSIFADEKTINLESLIVQNFDSTEEQSWFVIGSKFSTANFPKLNFVNAWPSAVNGQNPPNKDKLMALGVAMLFDRMEYNWVDIVPGTKTVNGTEVNYQPFEIPLPGRISMLDVWAWSANFDYYMEVFIRDYTGVVHTIPLGSLSFGGWKNLRANIPTNIQQSKKYLPNTENLTLVKLRIWTKPTERVTMPVPSNSPEYKRAIYFYFDNIKVLTDTFDSLYDGSELVEEEVIKQNWSSGSNDSR